MLSDIKIPPELLYSITEAFHTPPERKREKSRDSSPRGEGDPTQHIFSSVDGHLAISGRHPRGVMADGRSTALTNAAKQHLVRQLPARFCRPITASAAPPRPSWNTNKKNRIKCHVITAHNGQ